jgi:RNA polymerase-binding transcription factor DksA
MEEPSMADITERLRGELSDMLELIRRAGGGVVFEEFPGDLEDNALQPEEADTGRAGEEREASSAVTQRMLIDETNRLAETLDRVRRGECGVSEETGELVAAAPLRGQRNAPVTRYHGP